MKRENEPAEKRSMRCKWRSVVKRAYKGLRRPVLRAAKGPWDEENGRGFGRGEGSAFDWALTRQRTDVGCVCNVMCVMGDARCQLEPFGCGLLEQRILRDWRVGVSARFESSEAFANRLPGLG
jgi:hypothetical protein